MPHNYPNQSGFILCFNNHVIMYKLKKNKEPIMGSLFFMCVYITKTLPDITWWYLTFTKQYLMLRKSTLTAPHRTWPDRTKQLRNVTLLYHTKLHMYNTLHGTPDHNDNTAIYATYTWDYLKRHKATITKRQLTPQNNHGTGLNVTWHLQDLTWSQCTLTK